MQHTIQILKPFLLLCLCFGVMFSGEAQEIVRHLKSNGIYKHQPNQILSKGFRQNFDQVCRPKAYLEIIDFVKPICKEENGSFSVQVVNAPGPYEYFLNDEFIVSQSEDSFTFDILKSGAFFIDVYDAEGEIHSISFGLNDDETEAISPSSWPVVNAFCSEQGSISRGSFSPLVRNFRVYSADGTLIEEFETGSINRVFLDPGSYYLRAQDEETACRAFYLFEIIDEPTLQLPLIEDFSTSYIYPDPKAWSDDYALVNWTYPINPPSIGVATLDGLNQYGMPYQAVDSEFDLIQGNADVLTSRPFCLSDIAVTDDIDSLFLKFFFQPQGYGDYPNQDDSLIVEITNDDLGWEPIYVKTGYNSNQINTPFEGVILPIAAENYLFNGFRFRFRTSATVSGNNDHWHLDYIILDTERGTFPLYEDVAFSKMPSPMLKNYSQMPWNQFVDNMDSELADNSDVSITVKNNFPSVENRTLKHSITEMCNGLNIYDYNAGLADVLGNISEEVTTSIVFISDDVEIAIDNNSEDFVSDSVVLENQWYLELDGGNSDYIPANDTVYQYQKFYNYFAYDDGTAERAYGLAGTGAEFAYEFSLNQPDQIQGIQVHFVNMNSNTLGFQFELKIWSSITAGTPVSELLFSTETSLTTQYLTEPNGFWTYIFDEPISLPAGSFYVGMGQKEDDILNLGFDLNIDASSNVLINYSGSWEESIQEGAVMLRPVMGSTLPSNVNVGVDELNETGYSLKVYPNPTQNNIAVYIEGYQDLMNFELFDFAGRKVLEQNNSSAVISLADLPKGIYVLRANDKNGNVLATEKVIKL